MKNYIIVLLTFVLLVSCGEFKRIKINRTIKDNNNKIEESILLENAFDHFPNISEAEFINSMFLIPPNSTVKHNRSQRAYSILVCSLIDSSNYLPENYLYKAGYFDKDNFIVSMIFKENVVFDNKNDIYYANSYPIPNFDEFDFKLGFEKVDTIIGGERYVYNKYKVPLDLEVYVEEASHGSFWKVKSDVYRPDTMGEWKNGYSKGIAISRKSSFIVYWFIIW